MRLWGRLGTAGRYLEKAAGLDFVTSTPLTRSRSAPPASSRQPSRLHRPVCSAALQSSRRADAASTRKWGMQTPPITPPPRLPPNGAIFNWRQISHRRYTVKSGRKYGGKNGLSKWPAFTRAGTVYGAGGRVGAGVIVSSFWRHVRRPTRGGHSRMGL